jgi:hypothetical protein
MIVDIDIPESAEKPMEQFLLLCMAYSIAPVPHGEEEADLEYFAKKAIRALRRQGSAAAE